MPRSTAKIAEPISGDQLFPRRARLALPLLVRQAELQRPIVYRDLAEELGMPNPRNLNYVLALLWQHGVQTQEGVGSGQLSASAAT